MAWETLRRGTPNNSGTNASVVTLRRSAVAFSAFFIRAHKLKEMTRVTIEQDREGRRLGFLFHNNADDPDCLIVSGDGGSGRSSRDKGGRSVQTSILMRQPWALRLKSKTHQKFQLK